MSDQAKRQKIEAIYQKASGSFPGIEAITADKLQELLREGSVVLVDVREPAEQQVSMIPGAITVEQFEQQCDRHKDATVVSYCTIGGRSGHYTRMLADRGFKAVNFKGAILAWTHIGGPLQNAEGPTRNVHVHSRKFNFIADGYEPVW